MLREIMLANKWRYFGAIILVIALATFYLNTYVLTQNVYYNSYAGKLTADQIEEAISLKRNWGWVAFIMIPLLLLIKISYNSIAVYTSSFLSGDTIHYKDVSDICIKAELIFILPVVIKLLMVSFIKQPEVIGDCNIMPLSVHSAIDYNKLPAWSIYPLQTMNVFELVYIYLLSRLYSLKFDVPLRKALKVAGGGYLVATLLWVLVVVFLSVIISME